jgi:hypothetical protein
MLVSRCVYGCLCEHACADIDVCRGGCWCVYLWMLVMWEDMWRLMCVHVLVGCTDVGMNMCVGVGVVWFAAYAHMLPEAGRWKKPQVWRSVKAPQKFSSPSCTQKASSRLITPGSRLHQAPGSRLMTPGFRLHANGSSLQPRGSRLQAHGSWLQAQTHGPRR